MPMKQDPPVLFTNALTLDELKQGTNTEAKGISAKVLKEYIDYRVAGLKAEISGAGLKDDDDDNE